MNGEFEVAARAGAIERNRFWSKVRRTAGCWLWTGAQGGEGYGRVTLFQKRFGAHRLSYVWAFGPIPSDLVLDHLCRTRLCVRPDHLEPVTVLENTRRGLHGQRTRCDAGHDLSGDNVYLMRGGGKPYRACRICRAAYKRAAYQRAKAKASPVH